MTSTKLGDMAMREERQIVRGEMDTSVLAPGIYYMRFALYRVDECGAEAQYDVVDKVAGFEVDESNLVNHMKWAPRYWGNTRLPDVKIVEKR